MMGEIRKFLCQNTNFVTREEKFKSVVRIALWDKFYPYGRGKKKQTNKQKTKQRPSKKVSNFQEAAGDIRVPVRNKERKMS